MTATNHPWCRDVSRDEAIRLAEDIEAAARVPLPDHRDLPQAVAELRERVAKLEAADATLGSGDVFADVGCGSTADEIDRLTAERDAAKEECERLRAILPPESERGQGVGEGSWAVFACKAVAERDEARADLATMRGKCDGLKDRVAELEAAAAANAAGEQQEPSCGSHAGESVRVVEDATVGSGDVFRDVGCGSKADEIDRLAAERDAALRERDAAQSESAGLRNRLEAESAPGLRSLANNLRDKLRCCEGALKRSEARVAELEAAAAANAGGEAKPEPVAWGVRNPDDEWVYILSSRPREGGGYTVVPLYAAPQPPRGWLTSEEREAVENARSYYHAQTCGMNEDGGWYKLHKRRQLACEALLARSMPPLVKVPKYFPMSWAHERDAAWIAAIREAGGEVAE